MSFLAVSKYRVRSSRTSSESRCSDSVVNPTRSANRTDTWRRSEAGDPPAAVAAIGVVSGATVPSDLTGVPHFPQKRSSGSKGAPQFEQLFDRAAPQTEQKLLPG